MIGIYDILTCIKFGDDRLRGLELLGVKFKLPVVLSVLTTLTLSCERVSHGVGQEDVSFIRV